MSERFYIKSVGVSITNLPESIEVIKSQIKKRQSHYVCVLNTRALYYAIKNKHFEQVQNSSFLTVPDGQPLSIIANLRGLKNVKKTSGPVLFREICKLSKVEKFSHFFYGSTPEVINKLQNNIKKDFPNLNILGAISPPFSSAQELVTEELVTKINSLNPTFVWLGLGAPKQEIVASLLKDKLDSAIIIGIGLVFEYEAGTVKRPPQWIQKYGFEWLYRVFKQFSRTKNFVLPFLFMVNQLILEFFKNKVFKTT